MSEIPILETLPVEQRLALVYAPKSIREAWLAGLALDVRLARIVMSSRETMLGQIRLAWWRDRLAEGEAPRGEPLLSMIFAAGLNRTDLSALVDAWEAVLVDSEAQSDASIRELAAARANWISGLADTGSRASAEVAGREWALADLSRMPPPHGPVALRMAGSEVWQRKRLPRALRPLAVLHALARLARSRGDAEHRPAALLIAARVGLLGF